MQTVLGFTELFRRLQILDPTSAERSLNSDNLFSLLNLLRTTVLVGVTYYIQRLIYLTAQRHVSFDVVSEEFTQSVFDDLLFKLRSNL